MNRNRAGLTLIELIVAMAISLIVLNAAYVVFVNTSRFISRIESVAAQSEIIQSTMMWSMAQKDAASYPQGNSAADASQLRRMGVTSMTDDGAFFTVTVKDFGQVPLLQPITVLVPKP